MKSIANKKTHVGIPHLNFGKWVVVRMNEWAVKDLLELDNIFSNGI